MLPTSARLLRLLTLLQAQRFWPGRELAERLEVTGRTLRRDIDRVRQLGYPVHATSGVAGGYQLAAGAKLPPLQLDEDEALAVCLAFSNASTGNVAGIEEASLRALGKLQRLMPEHLQRKVATLRAAILPLDHAHVRAHAEVLGVLASASREHVQVRLNYADGSKRKSQRLLEPHGLVHTGYRWYLVAWDVQRADFRTFRADRIESVPELAARFSPRPLPDGTDLRSYVSRSLSLAPHAVQARVRIFAPLAVASARVPPTIAYLERLDETRCVLVMGGHSVEEVAGLLLSLKLPFAVEEPHDLLTHLEQLQKQLEVVLTRSKQLNVKVSASPTARRTALNRRAVKKG